MHRTGESPPLGVPTHFTNPCIVGTVSEYSSGIKRVWIIYGNRRVHSYASYEAALAGIRTIFGDEFFATWLDAQNR
jgi:hypothetical protein